MSNQTKVSFVIPIYNMEKYLARCLDSILQQTVSDYEVLMIDDGSSDGSKKIAEKYLADKRFHYTYQKNSGVSAARNSGIFQTHGEWIAFIDPDDYIVDNYLEELLKQCDSDTDITACCCKCDPGSEVVHFYDDNYVFTDDDSIKNSVIDFKVKSKKELLLELINANYGSQTNRKTAIGVPWGKLYRRSFLKDKQLQFDLKLFRYQDNIFNMFAFDVSKKIVYLNEPLYIYNLDNITDYNRKYTEKARIYLDMICSYRYSYLVEKDLLKDPQVYQEYCGEIYRHSDAMLRKYFLSKSNPNSAEEKVKALSEHFSKQMYVDVFHDENARKTYLNNKSVLLKIRILLLIKRKYRLLLLFDSMIQSLRKTQKSN